MAEFKTYDCLHDALYRFACGAWPPAGQQFEYRTRDEVARALKWLDQLDREHEREEWEQQMADRAASKAVDKAATADVVALPPRLNS
jgi:hypothetical protein